MSAANSRKENSYGPLLLDFHHTDLSIQYATIEIGCLEHFVPHTLANVSRVPKELVWANCPNSNFLLLQDISALSSKLLDAIYTLPGFQSLYSYILVTPKMHSLFPVIYIFPIVFCLLQDVINQLHIYSFLVVDTHKHHTCMCMLWEIISLNHIQFWFKR